MDNNIFYDENLQQGRVGNKRGPSGIPVIAMSIYDGTEHWFTSVGCASDSLNVSRSGISSCLSGVLHQHGGYHFRYADNAPTKPLSQNLEALAEWRREIIESPGRNPVIVTNLEDGTEQFYPSVRTAAKELGVYDVYISRAIEGSTKCVPNYAFRYATEEDIR